MSPEVKKALDDSTDILNIVSSRRSNIIPDWNLYPVLKVGKIFSIVNLGTSTRFIGIKSSYYLHCNDALFIPTKTCFKLANDLLLLAKYYEDKR